MEAFDNCCGAVPCLSCSEKERAEAQMSRSFFVTGTDTGIGKTHVSAALCQHFAKAMRTAYFKPVQSGCIDKEGIGLMSPDLEYVLARADIIRVDDEDAVPYRLATECSPHLAAKISGIFIDKESIKLAFRKISLLSDMIIIEGAGGVHTPISDRESMLDIMRMIGSPVIIVTSPRLGTINHTKLTVDAIEQSGLDIAGIVFNSHENSDRDFIYYDNFDMVRKIAGRIPVAELAHC